MAEYQEIEITDYESGAAVVVRPGVVGFELALKGTGFIDYEWYATLDEVLAAAAETLRKMSVLQNKD